jgi:riboflavin synthase
MFTGIIESIGEVLSLHRENSNLRITLQSAITPELRVDQSVSHNGVCLTVVEVHEYAYSVIAVDETLQKTNLGNLRQGDKINLERSMKADGRLDGHIVQGHIDTVARLERTENKNGSYLLHFSFPESFTKYVVHKGSICVNGVSLTVVETVSNSFSVAIIPYTWQHTNLQYLTQGDTVNIEFDVIGKYVEKMLGMR